MTCPLNQICSRTCFHCYLPNSPISVKECTLPTPVSCHGGPRPTHCYSTVPSQLTSSVHPRPPHPVTHCSQELFYYSCSNTCLWVPPGDLFKSKVTASEAFNLNLKGKAPPLTLTLPTPPPPPSSSPQSHIRSSCPPQIFVLCVCLWQRTFVLDDCWFRRNITF